MVVVGFDFDAMVILSKIHLEVHVKLGLTDLSPFV